MDGSPIQEEVAWEHKAKEEGAANTEFDKWKSAFVVDRGNPADQRPRGELRTAVQFCRIHQGLGQLGLGVCSLGVAPNFLGQGRRQSYCAVITSELCHV